MRPYNDSARNEKPVYTGVPNPSPSKQKGGTYLVFAFVAIYITRAIDPNVRLCFLLLWYPWCVSTPCVLSTPPHPPAPAASLGLPPFYRSNKAPSPLTNYRREYRGVHVKWSADGFQRSILPDQEKLAMPNNVISELSGREPPETILSNFTLPAFTADEGTSAQKR